MGKKGGFHSWMFERINFPADLKIVSFNKPIFPKDNFMYVFIFQIGIVCLWNVDFSHEESLLEFIYFYVNQKCDKLINKYYFIDKYI